MQATKLGLLIVAVLTTSCANCADDPGVDPDPWQVGEDGPDVGAAVDQSTSPPTDDGMPATDSGPVQYWPTCVGARTTVFQAASTDFVLAPVVADDRVFVTSRRDEGSGELALREWTEDGWIDHVDIDFDSSIVGFSDTHIWMGSVAGPLRRFALGDGQVLEIRADLDYARQRWAYQYAPMRRTAVGDRFAWAQEDVVAVLEGETVRLLGMGPAEAPWVTDRAIVYEYPVGTDYLVRMHVGDDSFDIGEDGVNGWPVVTDSGVFFVRDGDVHATNLTGGDSEVVLDDGFCGPLHANAKTVVTACASNPGSVANRRADYLALNADKVWEIDAETRAVREIPTNGGVVFAPVVNDRWIVWGEYDSDLGSQPVVNGEVMVFPRGAQVPTSVGLIGSGCPFCGAYWPPPRLILGEDTLAWNYGVEAPIDEQMFGPRDGYGVARLVECE